MKNENKLLKELFYSIEKELLDNSPILFIVSTILAVASVGFLVTINLLFIPVFLVYPIWFMIILSLHNYFNVVVISAVGLRNSEIPKISRPYIPIHKIICARKLHIVYESSENKDDSIKKITDLLSKFKKYSTVHYFGMISVPFNVLIGYSIGQKRKVNIYNFDRTKSDWEMIRDFSSSSKVRVSQSAGKIANKTSLILPLSYTIDENLLWNDDYQKTLISIDSMDIDKDIPYSELMGYITKTIKDKDEVHIYASINNGFAFYLGTRLADSNLPNAIVYEYGGKQNREYTFAININERKCIYRK